MLQFSDLLFFSGFAGKWLVTGVTELATEKKEHETLVR